MTTGMVHLQTVAAIPVPRVIVREGGHKMTQSVERRVQYAT